MLVLLIKKIIRQLPKALLVCVATLLVVASYFVSSQLYSKSNVAYAASFNKQINYQGKLTNTSNVAVPDGLYHMTFRLYTTATGGSPIWTEDRSTEPGDRATVTNGLFSILLGSSTALTNINFNQPLYLGVEIGGSGGSPVFDGEMTPRKLLGAVPAAFEADNLDGISSEQFIRNDITNATSTATTSLSVIQYGSGKIAEFLGANASSALSILSNGNVSVGTSTPYARLSVWGLGTGTNALAQFTNSASTSVMTLLDNGNLGLGTTSPAWRLSVSGIGSFDDYVRASYFTATSSTASTFPYASTTMISAVTASSTNLWLSGIASGFLLKTSTGGQVVAAVPGTDFSNFAFPFTPSIYGGQAVVATSTGLWLTGTPLSLIASSTFVTYATTTNATSTNMYVSGSLSTANGVDTGIVFKDANNLVSESSLTWSRSIQKLSASSSLSAFEVSGTVDPTGASNSGITIDPLFQPSNSGKIYTGITSSPKITGSQRISSVTGVLSSPFSGPIGGTYTSTTTNVIAYDFQPTWTNGTALNMYGYRISSFTTNASAPVGNFYGLYMDDITVGTSTNYAIKTGLGTVSFGDKVGIGSSTPSNSLSVQGNGYVAGSLFVSGAITSTSSSASTFPYASTTMISATTASSTNLFALNATSSSLAVLNLSAANCDLKASTSGSIYCGTDSVGSTFGFPFTPSTSFGNVANATDTLMLFTQGISASSTIRFGNAGVSTFTYDSTTGNLGLGTTTTASKLTVLGFWGDAASTLFNIASSTSSNGTTSAPIFTALLNGKIGVGTSTPGTLFAVQGAGLFSGNLFVGGNIVSTSSSASVFPYASTTALSATGSAYLATLGGSVGIGTTTPGALLSVHGGNEYIGGNSFIAGTITSTSSSASTFPYASTTMISATTASSTNLWISGIAPGSILKTNSSGQVAAAVVGTDFSNFAFPFTPTNNFNANTNATGTTLLLTAGLQASTTVRFGNAGISNFIFDGSTGKLGLGTSTPYAKLSVLGAYGDLSTATTLFSIASSTSFDGSIANSIFSVLNNGSIGIGTTSPVGSLNITRAITGTANYGVLSVGPAPWDGASSGTYSGSSGGSLIAVNAPNQSGIDLINLQTFGSSRFKVTSTGAVSMGGGGAQNGQHVGDLLVTTTGAINLTSEPSPFLSVTGSSFTITGSYATQRFNLFGQPTITAGSSLSISSEANTFNIAGAPISAGSATIAKSIALRVSAGTSIASGVTSGYGLYVDAPTGAVNNYSAAFLGGNLGIGTTTPGALLSVHGGNEYIGGNSFIAGTITSTSSSASTFPYASTTAFTTSGTGYFGGLALGATSTPSSLFSVQGSGIISSNLFVGGAITSTSSSASTFPYASTTMISATTASSTNLFALNATSSSLAVLNLSAANCDLKATTAGSIYCGTDATAAGSGAFPFTPTSNFNANTNATGTTLLLTAGLQASTTVRFGNAGVSNFIFDGSTGNLGLGTTSPFAMLSVAGVGSFDSYVRASYFVATSSIASVFPYASTTALSATGSAYLATLGGSVGIGTSTPGALFAVHGGNEYIGGNSFIAGTITSTSTFASTIPNASTTNLTTSNNIYFGGVGELFYAGGLAAFSHVSRANITDLALAQSSTGHTHLNASGNPLSGGIGFHLDGGSEMGQLDYTGWNFGTTTRFYSGNVGIGSSSPNNLLSVQGSEYISGNSFIAGTITSTSSSASTFPYASTTMITATTASTTNLWISGIAAGSLLKTTTGGQVVAAVAGADYSNFAFPFTPTTSFGGVANATGTTLLLTNGLSASSTIRFGNAGVSGLTFDSTTGSLNLGNTITGPKLSILGTYGDFSSTLLSIASSTSANGLSSNTVFTVLSNGNVGIGTSTPYAPLAVNGQVVASYYTATSTLATSTLPILSVPNTLSLPAANGFGGDCLRLKSNNIATTTTCGTTLKMEQIYGRLTKQDASVYFIGDSTVSPVNSPRWSQSIFKKWDVPWVGVTEISVRSGTTDELWANYNNASVTTAPGASFSDGSGTNDTSLTFDEYNNTTFLKRSNLTNLLRYLRGDWTRNDTIRASMILHKPNDTQVSGEYTIFQRDNGNSVFTSPFDYSITPTYATVTTDFTNFDRHSTSELDFFAGNDNHATASMHIGGMEFFIPNKTGFSIALAGVGGSNTNNWRHSDVDASGFWSQTQIRNTLGLLNRKINTLFIQLGINCGTNECSNTDASKAAYKAHIEGIIDDWVSDIVAAGTPMNQVRVLLINPWNGTEEDSYPKMRGEALRDIASERDYVSFIDLNQLLLDTYGPDWTDAFTSDTVHQTTAGVEAIGELTWAAISGTEVTHSAPTWITSADSSYYGTGKVGVGTSSPFAQLAVHANANAEYLPNLFTVASSTLTSTTTLFTIQTNGNVGIGTSTPSVALSVTGSGYIGGNLFVGGTITSTSSSASTFPFASTTMITATTASTTNLWVSGIASSSILKTSAGGRVVAAIPGVDYANFAFPFTAATYGGQAVNSTTTALLLTGSPFSLLASSTIITNSTTTNATSTNLYASGSLSMGSGVDTGLVFKDGNNLVSDSNLLWNKTTQKITASSSLSAFEITGTVDPTGANTSGTALNIDPYFQPSNSGRIYWGQTVQPKIAGSQRIDAVTGILNGPFSNSSGQTYTSTTTNVVAYDSSPFWGSGTALNMYGYKITSPSRSPGAPVGNFYGLQMDDLTIGTSTNYAIKTGLGKVSFGDSVGIGSTTPSNLFSVQGSGYIANNLFVGGIITSTSSSASTFPYASTTMISATTASSTNLFSLNATSSSLAVLNLSAANCDVKATTAGSLYCGTDATSAGGGTYPFTPTNNFGIITSATSSTVLLTQGLQASTTVRFGNAGVSNFIFDGSTGNLGLGTSTTASKLSVLGTYGDSASTLFNIASSTSVDGVTSNPVFTVLRNNNVGVGTSTPGALFAVQGSGNFSSNLFVGGNIVSTSSSASVFPYASTTALSATGSAYLATIGGSVGVATTSAYGLLSVEQGTEGASLWVGNTGSSTPSFVVNGVNGNGNVGIGVAVPTSHLQVNVSDLTGVGYKMTGRGRDGVGDTANGVLLAMGHNTSLNRQFGFFDSEFGNGIRVIGSALDGYNLFSDTRLALTLGTDTTNVNVGSTLSVTTRMTAAYASTTYESSTGSAFFATAGGSVGIGVSAPPSSDNPNTGLEVNGNLIFSLGSSRTISPAANATGDGLGNNNLTVAGGQGTCFLAGTQITLADGSHKNIEDIAVGDGVLSYDEKTHQTVVSTVDKLFHHPTEEMTGDYYLIITTEKGREMKVTYNHRIYSAGAWVDAGNLVVGSPLLNDSNETDSVASIQRVEGKVPTYNFEVEKYHVYYAEGILVHNAKGAGPSGGNLYLTGGNSLVSSGTAGAGRVFIYGGLSNGVVATSSNVILANTGTASRGFVGIGTSTPYARLSVWGDGTGTNALAQFTNNASTSVMTLLDNGNLGLGTTSPFAKLSVAGIGSFDDYVRASYFVATSTTATSTFAGFIDVTGTGSNATSTFTSNLWVKGTLRTGTGSIYLNDTEVNAANGGFHLDTSATSTFATNGFAIGNDKFVVQQTSGNVGIGTSSPSSMLSVVGSAYIGANLFVSGTINSTSTNAFSLPYASTTMLSAVTASSTNLFSLNATSSSLAVLNLSAANCDVKATTAGSLYCGTDATGSGGGVFPFTPTFNFNANTNATGTTLLLTAGLQASTTVRFGNAGASNFLFDGTSGNLGLGTTSPFGRLSIEQDTETASLWVGNTGSSTPSFVVTGVNGNGNIGIGSSTPNAKLGIDAGVTSNINAIDINGSINDFFQVNIQNRSTGTGAQAGFSATADNGTPTSNFAWVGINNSNFYNPQTYNVGGAGDVEFLGSGNDMYLANNNATKSMYFLTGGTSTTTNTRLAISATGNVGVGTSTPGALFAVQGSAILSGNLFVGGNIVSTSSLASIFPYASTTAFTVSGTTYLGGNTVINSVGIGAGLTDPSLIDAPVTFGQTTGLKFDMYAGAGYGIGIQSGTMILASNPAFGGNTIDFANNTTVGRTSYMSLRTDTGFLGIGTTTPRWMLSVAGPGSFDDYVRASYFVATSTTATSTLAGNLQLDNGTLTVDAQNNKVGVGTMTPFATLAVTGTTGAIPSFVVSTSSINSTANAPLFYVDATTTGMLDWERVAVGTSTTNASGLRDQFTVAGRIYTTWNEMRCDSFGANLVANVTADTPSMCGSFAFDQFGATTQSFLTVQTTANPVFARMTGGSSTVIQGSSVAIRSWALYTAPANNPVMEAVVREPTAVTGGSTVWRVGFTNNAVNASYASTTSLNPQGAYFEASTTYAGTSGDTGSWIAVVKKTGSETDVNTLVATSTTNFQKMRVELTSSDATFLINGKVVAKINTSIPTGVNLTPIVSVGAALSAPTATARNMDISSFRVWSDDPPGGVETEAGPPGRPTQTEYDGVSGAEISEAYLVDNLEDFAGGTVVSIDSEENLKLKRSTTPYEPGLFGVISSSAASNLGVENERTVRVATAGRVPVFVSDEGGDIKPGDYLTSSSRVGVAMKANRSGQVIGRAVASFTGSYSEHEGTILMAIEPQYYASNHFAFDDAGNLGLGTLNPTLKLDVVGDIRSLGFAANSTRSSMTNIYQLQESDYQSDLEKIKNIHVSTFRYNSDTATTTRMGIIADEAPTEILSVNGDVDVYKLATFAIVGVKAEQLRIDSLEARIAALESAIATSTSTMGDGSGLSLNAILTGLENLGVRITDGLAYIKNLTTDRLSVGSSAKPTGITLYDDVNGNPYCLRISNGQPKTVPGECTTEVTNPTNPTDPTIGGSSQTSTTTVSVAPTDPPTEPPTGGGSGEGSSNENGGNPETPPPPPPETPPATP